MIKCVHCGAENEPIFTYCLSCGKPLEQSLSSFKPRATTSTESTCCLFAVRSDGGLGTRYDLRDGTNTIGSKGPEIVVKDDPRVADEHASIEVGGDSAFLEDLGTRHGTFLRIRDERTLSNGDQLRIGHALFNVEMKGKNPQPAPDGSTWLGSSGHSTDFCGRLLRLGPDNSVLEAHLLKTSETTLGRTGGDILMPDDPFVSSRHAVFAWSGDSCVLRDVGSTNGCYMRARGRVGIEDGDHILLGHHVFQFSRSNDDGES